MIAIKRRTRAMQKNSDHFECEQGSSVELPFDRPIGRGTSVIAFAVVPYPQISGLPVPRLSPAFP